jgi:pimeloyl-ACP methyl ester carboxylesterase
MERPEQIPLRAHGRIAAILATSLLAAGVNAAAPTLVACTLPELEEPARCGTLDVPEDPERPAGRKITIAFAVIPATGGAALPDPIVPLYGGPGENVLSAAGYIARQLAGLRPSRDILLVDQRGTGRSGALNCRLFDPAAPDRSLQDFLPPDAVRACARELSTRADLTQYSYLHFAQDLERIREALGYAQYNLNAGSYGTRAAQAYLWSYPEGIRTVLLHSVVPPDVITPLSMAKSAQPQFEATLAACEADTACRAAYPRLRQEFDEVLDRLDAGAVRHSIPGAPQATLHRGRALEWLRAKLYRPRTAAELPWLIHEAHRGNWSPFFDGILEQARGFDAEYSLGLWLSITCSDDVAFLEEAQVAPATENTYLGDYRVRQQQAACRLWPRAELPAGHRKPVQTSIPTMFVSGDLDAATPLSFTQRVAPGFTNRVEIVSHGQGHTEWNDCVDRLYRRFVETGQAAGIEPLCPAIPRPPFRLPDTRPAD